MFRGNNCVVTSSPSRKGFAEVSKYIQVIILVATEVRHSVCRCIVPWLKCSHGGAVVQVEEHIRNVATTDMTTHAFKVHAAAQHLHERIVGNCPSEHTCDLGFRLKTFQEHFVVQTALGIMCVFGFAEIDARPAPGGRDIFLVFSTSWDANTP